MPHSPLERGKSTTSPMPCARLTRVRSRLRSFASIVAFAMSEPENVDVEEAYFGSGARTGSVLPSTWFTGTLLSPY